MTSDPSASPSLEIRLLGRFEARVAGSPVDAPHWRRRKVQLVVKLLALSPRQRLHREQICDTLWPDLDLGAALNQLSKTLHVVRRTLEPDLPSRGASSFVATDGPLVELRAPGGLWIDADAFEREAANALRCKRADATEAALALYAGDLLPGELYEDWAAPRRRQLQALRRGLLEQVADLYAASGQFEDSLVRLRELLALDPADESAHRRAMRVHARAGRFDAAVRQFHECCEVLRRDLDAEPDGSTKALFERIRAEAATRSGPAAAMESVSAAIALPAAT